MVKVMSSSSDFIQFSDRTSQVKEMITCTRKAWNLVKGRIYMHGNLLTNTSTIMPMFTC